MRASLAADVPDILAQLVTAAKAGDTQAARLILERVLPPLKPSELPVVLQMPDSGTFTAKANAVLSATADGDLAPSQGATLLNAIGTLAKIAEIDQLAARISSLEKLNGDT